MRSTSVYVEDGVAMASDRGSATWVFDLEFWGCCGQGSDQESALVDLQRVTGGHVDLVVAERITGDECAFARDRLPCTETERLRTLSILVETRPQTIKLLRSCSESELDWDDPDRVLPAYASWRTLRQMGWHIADTESRYYLPCLELGYREPARGLVNELQRSADYVRETVEMMPPALIIDGEQGSWTTVKLLRRLAWHERSELIAMRAILARQRTGR